MKRYHVMLYLVGVILITITIAVTYAFIYHNSIKTNSFLVGDVTPEIKETFVAGNKLKEDVYIKNNGNIDVYVRVALVFSFEDANGNVLSSEPVLDDDYTISFSSSNKWVKKSDGYYYYKEKVSPSSSTDILIDSCQGIKTYSDKTFNLDIAVQAIQAEPKRAIEEAWNVTISNGLIN